MILTLAPGVEIDTTKRFNIQGACGYLLVVDTMSNDLVRTRRFVWDVEVKQYIPFYTSRISKVEARILAKELRKAEWKVRDIAIFFNIAQQTVRSWLGK